MAERSLPARTELLITAEQLAAELAGANAPVVLDVRWRLDEPDGHAEYLAVHIPTAQYVSLETELAAHGLVFDARAAERYRGEVEPIDPCAGHIPGAHNTQVSSVFDERGRFRSTEQLHEQFADLSVQSGVLVGAYCGSGVSAAPLVLALTLAGYSPVLYPGSWSQWSNHAARPLATGSTPG